LKLPSVADVFGISVAMFSLDGCEVSNNYLSPKPCLMYFLFSLSRTSSTKAESRRLNLSRESISLLFPRVVCKVLWT
jgi:hypothetical protein